MAKKITNKATNDDVTIGGKDIEVINPKLQAKLKGIQEKKEEKTEEVKVVATNTAKPKATMVKVKLNRDHRCYIGGEWYTFKANTQYNVPENVKTILMGANLLLPL